MLTLCFSNRPSSIVSILVTFTIVIAGCNFQPATSSEIGSGTITCPVGQLDSPIQLDPIEADPVDQLPRFLEFAPPQYPRLARQAGLEGRTWVRLLVDSLGLPHEAQMYKSSGVQSLDEAAVAAAGQCRFIPGRWHGENVSVRIMYAVDFVLE